MPALKMDLASRFKDTPFLVESGKVSFDLWERPAEFADKAVLDVSVPYTVRECDIGRLDLIAYDRYQNVGLWWIIAAVNNIVNPFEDMVAGDTIYIPPYQYAIQFLHRGSAIS